MKLERQKRKRFQAKVVNRYRRLKRHLYAEQESQSNTSFYDRVFAGEVDETSLDPLAQLEQSAPDDSSASSQNRIDSRQTIAGSNVSEREHLDKSVSKAQDTDPKGSVTVSKRKKVDAFAQARKKFEEKQREADLKEQQRQHQVKDIKRKRRQRTQRRKKFLKKTRTGQPVMASLVERYVHQLENSS